MYYSVPLGTEVLEIKKTEESSSLVNQVAFILNNSDRLMNVK